MRGKKKCLLQRWLDNIEDGTAGKAELVDIVTLADTKAPDFRPRSAVVAILARLGLDTHEDAIGDHRAKRCRCFR